MDPSLFSLLRRTTMPTHTYKLPVRPKYCVESRDTFKATKIPEQFGEWPTHIFFSLVVVTQA
jgi:hypothetical protein